MKRVSQSEASVHKNSENCTIYEYGHSELSDCAKAVINGRYPVKNFALNEMSEMTVFVLSGLGRIATKDTVVELEPGDACFIGKNEPYYYEGEDLAILMFSTPAWTPEQYKEVE